MGGTVSSVKKENSWKVCIHIAYSSPDDVKITYLISSEGSITKTITSGTDRKVIFNVEHVNREMTNSDNEHVGKDGNFDEFLEVMLNLTNVVRSRWSLEYEQSCDTIQSKDNTSWTVDIRIPSELKVVNYLITSDTEGVVKSVSDVSTSKSTVFNIDLEGNSKLIDDIPAGSDGDRDKMIEVLNSLLTTLLNYHH